MNTSNPAGRHPPPAPRHGAHAEAQRRQLAGLLPQAREQLRRAHVEVAREHRARAVQDQPAVAREARRPDLVGERSGGRPPGAADRRQAGVGRRAAERAAEDRADVLEAAHPGIIPDAPARRRRGSRDRRPRRAGGCRSPSRAPGPRGRRSPSRLCARLQVELAGDVVEQQHRPQAAHLAHEVGLGGQQREHGRALLALRAVAAQVALALREGELVVMRARPRCCRARCRRRGAPRARPAGRPRPRARAPRSAARRAPRARRSPPDARANGSRSAATRRPRARRISAPSCASCASQGASASCARAPARSRRSSWLRCCRAPA